MRNIQSEPTAYTTQNVVGAAGVIGDDRVAKALPDGHTRLVTGDPAMALRGSMDPKLPYVARRDFAPISQLAITPNILVVAHAGPSAIKAVLDDGKG